jgi:transcriptional regulator with XRE-family HTH domain
MSTLQAEFVEADHVGSANRSDSSSLHRIATVRRQQGVSLRTAARHMGTDIRTVREQESSSSDIRLSELYKWQATLDVPIEDLLVEPEMQLSRPVLERARMLRLMKTVVAIRERSESAPVQRMAQTMIDQLVEIMPELEEVNGWHSVGQRRSMYEYGRIAEQPIPDAFFGPAIYTAEVG